MYGLKEFPGDSCLKPSGMAVSERVFHVVGNAGPPVMVGTFGVEAVPAGDASFEGPCSRAAFFHAKLPVETGFCRCRGQPVFAERSPCGKSGSCSDRFCRGCFCPCVGEAAGGVQRCLMAETISMAGRRVSSIMPGTVSSRVFSGSGSARPVRVNPGGDDAVDDGGQCPVVFGDVLSEEDGVAPAFVEIAVDWPVQFFAVFIGDPLLGTAGGIDGVFDGEDERAAGGERAVYSGVEVAEGSM